MQETWNTDRCGLLKDIWVSWKGIYATEVVQKGQLWKVVLLKNVLHFAQGIWIRIMLHGNNQEEINEDGYEQGGSSLSIFSKIGRFLSTPKECTLSSNEVKSAHLYLLCNCKEVEPYIRCVKREWQFVVEILVSLYSFVKYMFYFL